MPLGFSGKNVSVALMPGGRTAPARFSDLSRPFRYQPDAPARRASPGLLAMHSRSPRWRVGLVWVPATPGPVSMRQCRKNGIFPADRATKLTHMPPAPPFARGRNSATESG